jgi:two-component system LytT family response regulator
MSDIIRAVLVEDELISRETLRGYIEKYCTGVEVVGEAGNVEEGKRIINETKPDLVFLDVEMPFGTGFDLLEQLDEITFETVFVTAYSNYAVKALNYSAAYYILKPVDIDELVKAVDKVREERKTKDYAIHTKVLVENLGAANNQKKKIVLPILEGFEVVEVQDVIRCQANDNFTDFFMKDGSKKLICRTLKFYDEILSELGFLRVHRSHLINMDYVKGYKKGKGGQVVMSDGSHVDVSPNRKDDFLKFFR